MRSTLAAVAMTAGVFGLGAILTSYAILTRELAKTYETTRPAAAIVSMDRIDDAIVALARRAPGVLDAEARPIVVARVRVGNDEWAPLVLFVVRDFNDIRIDRFHADSGAWPPTDHEVLIERSAMPVARASLGQQILMRTADGVERSLRVSGTVHAAGLAPGWMDHVVTGFVTWNSIARADSRAEGARLRIRVQRDALDERHIQVVAAGVAESLARRGVKTGRIEIPAPGRHPHADQMDTFLFLLGCFGALTFVLSGVLVANMIHALLSEQVKQVAVMKSIGAMSRQILALYLGQVAMLAAIAVAIGIPLAVSAGRAYARFSATILNATLSDEGVPAWVFVVEIAVGIVVPVAIAFTPVVRAARMSIHEAFSNGIGRHPFGTRPFDRWLARIGWLPRPLMLSLRTAFHRRGRLLLTVMTLAAGGAVFIAALNIAASWARLLEADGRSRRYDVEIRFLRPYPIDQIDAAVRTIPDVTRAEYWNETGAVASAPNGREIRVTLIGVEPATPLLRLPILSGRWLQNGDRDVVVINQHVLSNDPSLRPGASMVLRIDGRSVTRKIAGVAKELSPQLTVYEPRAATISVRTVRVVTRRHDPKSQLAAARAVENALRQRGIGVSQMQSLTDSRKAFADHLVIIKSALVFAAVLVVFVGVLALVSTLTLSVTERTRELGVLSAIGATPRAIARTIVWEALVIGVLSWVVAIVATIPATLFIGGVAGRMFHKTPLDFFMSPLAVLTWLFLVLILGSISSLYPARRAARLTVREALNYE